MYGYTPDKQPEYKELLNYQEEIWKLVLGFHPVPFKRIRNPFRVDHRPDCWFEWGHTRLFLVDYADYRYHNMTCFDAVSRSKGLSFKDTLIYIDEQLGGVGTTINPSKKLARDKKDVGEIEIRSRRFLKVDRDFWEPFSISSEDLKEDGVMALSWYKFKAKDGRHIVKSFRRPVNSYGIVFPNHHKKIYNPKLSRESGKFITNCKADDIGNWQGIKTGDLLIITKSYKDHRILRNLGYDVIWMQNEGIALSPEKVKQVSGQYKKVVLIYDNDAAGRLAAKRLTELYNSYVNNKNFSWSTFPERVREKDPGEFITAYGKKPLADVIKTLLIHAA